MRLLKALTMMPDPSPFYQNWPQQIPGLVDEVKSIAKEASKDISKDLENIYDDVERLVSSLRFDDSSAALKIAEDVRDSVYRLLR